MPQFKPLDDVASQISKEGKVAFLPLLHPKLLEDAQSSQVVWARVKGYPFWPAQVLNESAAHKKLGKVSHRKSMDVPVMFFGTLEIAWIGSADIVSFKDGVQLGYLTKGKHKNFLRACTQVHEFLVLDRKRKAPQYWWCRAPGTSSDAGEEDEAAPAPTSKPSAPARRSKSHAKGKVAKANEDDSTEGEEADSSEEAGEAPDAEATEEEEEEDDAADLSEASNNESSSEESDAEQDQADAEAAATLDADERSKLAAEPAGEVNDEEDEEQQDGVTVPAPRHRKHVQHKRGSGKATANGKLPAAQRGRPSVAGSIVPSKRKAHSLSSGHSDAPSSSQTISEQLPTSVAAVDTATANKTAEGAAGTAAQPSSAAAGKHASLTTGSAGTTSLVPSTSTSSKQHAGGAEDDSKLGSVGGKEDSRLGSTGLRDNGADATLEMGPPDQKPARKRRKVAAGQQVPTSSDGAPVLSGEADAATGVADAHKDNSYRLEAAARPAVAAGAEDALQPALQVKVSTMSSTSQEAPAMAAAASVFDDDIYKLPAEIRRLAGIKLVKKSHATAQAAAPAQPVDTSGQQQQAISSTRPRAAADALGAKQEEQAADSPQRERDVELAKVSDSGAADLQSPKRRETRSGPKGISKPQPGAAQGKGGRSIKLEQIQGQPAQPAQSAVPQPQVSDSSKPSSPTVTSSELTGRKSGVLLGDKDRNQQRIADREQQLQRKRLRERERRQLLKQKQQEEAAAAAAAAMAHENGDSDNEHEQDAEGEMDADITPSAAVAAAVDGIVSADHGVGHNSKGQLTDSMPSPAGPLADRQAATIDCSIMPSVPLEALELLEGLRASLREGGTGQLAVGGSSMPGSPNAEAGMLGGSAFQGRPPRPAGSTGRMPSREGRKARGRRFTTERSGEVGPRGTAVPVVSVSAGARKQAIPPVLATDAQPLSRSPGAGAGHLPSSKHCGLLTKHSSDSMVTSSDTPSADMQGGSPVSHGAEQEQLPDAAEEDGTAQAAEALQQEEGPGGATGAEETGLDILDAEAAEALQFMQSQSLLSEPAQPLVPVPGALQADPSPPLADALGALDGIFASCGLNINVSAQLVTQPLISPLAQPLSPQVYKPPRKASVQECAGFQWPDAEPMLPPQQDFFFLPREWLVARPPKYEVIKRSVWVSKPRPKRLHREEVNVCQCKPPADHSAEFVGCGHQCLNRRSYVLCDTKYCPCGEACSNKPFQFMRTPRIEMFLTQSRGYGVRACQPIKAHGFVIEYVGEVIDEKELARRMEAARHTAQHSYYIMELAPNTFLDARHKGNVARLLNSSCDPNCETQKWYDAATGEPRIGIFAKRDIEPGEELTYNYHFEQYSRNGVFNATQFECMCGAVNCRGIMDNPLNNGKNKDYGRRIEVYWDEDGMYYPGTVISYSVRTRQHTVIYDDGDKEDLVLEDVQHRWLDNGPARPPSRAAAAAAQALAQTLRAGSGLLPYSTSDAEALEDAADAALGRTGPAKKKQKTAQALQCGSMLPPLRAGLDNSYNSTSTTANVSPSGLPHAASAPATFSARGARERSGSYNEAENGGYGSAAVFGGDMESLLQAVEVELGGREAAAVGAAGGAVDGPAAVHLEGGAPAPGLSPTSQQQQGAVTHHLLAVQPAPRPSQSLPNPHGTSRAGRHAVHTATVRSPMHRRQHHQAQQAAAGAPPTWGAAQVQPGTAQSGHHTSMSLEASWPWGNGHVQLPAAQHADSAVAQPAAAGLQGNEANDSTALAAVVAGSKPQVVIEEVLGIRISQFDMPLFQPSSGHRRAGTGRHVTPVFSSSLVAAAAGVSSTPEVPPHLQRTPITTSSPGLGPSGHTVLSTHGNAMLPHVSSAGPSPPPAAGGVLLAVQEGRQAAGHSSSMAGHGPYGTHGARGFNEALALLVNSPVLAAMTGLQGGLRSYEALAGELDLFKRNGSHGSKKFIEQQHSYQPVPAAAGGQFAMPTNGKAALFQIALPNGLQQLH